ncbi:MULTISPECIES: hypothetical protein [unclassified Streptomyces]|uniref:hypothetical protein n=1 Tax=unclassified Streptomyces TaxID=2593676 RepID=UPI0033E5F260
MHEHAADVAVTLPFDHGARSVTVRGAKTVGKPVEGDTVAVVYAPGRPELGARHDDHGFFTSGFALLWIWALTFFVSAFAAGIFAMSPGSVHSRRRFSAHGHGVAALFPLALAARTDVGPEENVGRALGDLALGGPALSGRAA